MKSIQTILQTNGIEFMDSLMNDYLVVYEKLNASTLSFRRIKNEIKFYKGRDNEEITSLNETLYSYFKEGIEYIKRVSLIFYMELPEGWLFRMQYFNTNSSNLVNYEYKPKNNLVLSCIDTGNSIIEDVAVLKHWAERFQIDADEPVFSGFLSEFQKDKLFDYVNGNGNFEGITFSQYILNLLNPSISHSAYSDAFNSGIDSFIFKFYNASSKKCMQLKLVDPYMDNLMKQNRDKFGNNSGTESEIILVNFIAWLQTIDIENIKICGESNEERYLDLLCKLFNMYISEEQKMFNDIKTNLNESYGVDIKKLKNDNTIKLLKSNPGIEKAFQVIVGSFVNKRDNNPDPISIMDDTIIEIFNKEVDDIRKVTANKDEKVLSFSDLLNTNSIEQSAKKTTDEKVMSFSELMDKIGNKSKDQTEDKTESNAKEDTDKSEEVEHKSDEKSETDNSNDEKYDEPENKDDLKDDKSKDKEDSKDDEPENKEDSKDDKSEDKEESKDDEPESKEESKDDKSEDKEDSKDDEPESKEDSKDDEPEDKEDSKDDEPEDKEDSKDDEPEKHEDVKKQEKDETTYDEGNLSL